MADLKISQLTELEDLTGQEMIPLSTEGTNRRVSSGKMKEYISSDTVPYKVDIGAIMTGSPASATVSDAIGGWDNLVAAINGQRLVMGYSEGRFVTAVHCELMDADKIIIAVNSESTAIKFRIVNTSGTLSCERVDTALQTSTDESLATTDKTVSGGINEVKAAADANTEAIGDVSEILERINNETL